MTRSIVHHTQPLPPVSLHYTVSVTFNLDSLGWLILAVILSARRPIRRSLWAIDDAIETGKTYVQDIVFVGKVIVIGVKSVAWGIGL